MQPFAGEDEAIALANGVDLGLASSASGPRTWPAPCVVSAELDFGCVWLNCHQVIPSSRCRTAATQQSGIGRDLSRYGLDDYMRVKHVMAAHQAP
ncbi:aldehyde dehydrogenase family protein [Streptomyces sp. KL116D]|uniref:aldehyde dehydrogenase family protein n=1 Tax=Streptomyces sp. KL116D TaxID=3045152 RepID=UPI0035590834